MENKIGYYQAKAETLMWEEGLVDNNWKFEYDNAKKRAGSCDSYKKIITVSRHLVLCNNSDEEIMNTILHEIAHALAPKYEHHGRIWRKIFKDLLIKYKQPVNVSRCYDASVKMPKGKWTLYCDCGKSWERHKKCWWFKHKNAEGYLTKCNCVCGQPKLKIKENK